MQTSARPAPLEDAEFHVQVEDEARKFGRRRPRKIPPATSSTRPALAALYRAAYAAVLRRLGLHSFTYRGKRYGVVWVASRLCVYDLRTARVLVGSLLVSSNERR